MRRRSRAVLAAALGAVFAALLFSSCRPPEIKSDPFLDEVQRATFDYFVHEAGENGLIQDRMTDKQLSSTMAGGYQLTAWCVAAERGWVSRREAADRVLKTLKTYKSLPKFHGIFAHFYDIQTGKVLTPVWANQMDDGADLSETGFLMGGVLTCRGYFNRDDPAEKEIRAIATELYEGVEWDWMLQDRFGNRLKTLSWHWSPKHGFGIGQRIKSTMELSSMITYLLAIGSPTHPIPADCWNDGWARDYRWGTYSGRTFVTCPPLFTHQYPHTWIDFRNRKDRFTDYFRNSTYATLANRDYCLTKLYPGQDIWGLTFSDGPDGYGLFGYPPKVAFSPVHDIDIQATVAPTGPGGSMVFTPKESLSSLKYMREKYGDQLWGKYGYYDSFSPKKNWFDKDYIGLDQGPILTMIENHRSGLVWAAFMKNDSIRNALARVGFVTLIDDFEPEWGAEPYSRWSGSGCRWEFTTDRVREGRRAMRVSPDSPEAVLSAAPAASDLQGNRFVSLWILGAHDLRVRWVDGWGGVTELEKAGQCRDSSGWTHLYFHLPEKALAGGVREVQFLPAAGGRQDPFVLDAVHLTSQLDVEIPAAVEAIEARLDRTPGEIILTWKPGHEGKKEKPFQYLVRYSTQPIEDAESFDRATPVTEPHQRISGADNGFTLADLETGKTYHFAIKAEDSEMNVSDLVTCSVECPKVAFAEEQTVDDFEDGNVRSWHADAKVFKLAASQEKAFKGGCSLKVAYDKKRKDDEWSFLEAELGYHNFARHRYLKVRVQGEGEVLVKAWNEPGREEDFKQVSRREKNGWTELTYDLSALESVDRKLVRKVLVFIEPGKTDCSGTMFIDAIELTNKAPDAK